MALYRMQALLAAGCLALLGGCSLPFGMTGGPPPTPKATTWEDDTAAGARALEEQRYDDAESHLEVARERAASGEGNELIVAASLSNLAIVRRTRGDTAGAIAAQQEALTIREQTQGADHPDVATALNSLAGLYASRDDYTAAEPLLVRALDIRERVLGADNRFTAQSVNNLALLYAAQQRYGDAEPLYKRSIGVFEQLEESQELAVTLENYAALLHETGRSAEAEQMEARARAHREP